MNNTNRTIASFFTVAMAAILVGAVVTTQAQRPESAMARPSEVQAQNNAPTPPRGPVTLDTFRDLAKGLTRGVVNINTSKVVKRQHSRDPFRDFFGDDSVDRFFGPQGGGGPERQSQRALGSGFVIDKAGYILTNRHVVEGADQISVTLVGGKTYEAKLVGRDARTDVALVKIEPKEPLTTLELGDSDQTEVGEWVMAIGNPFGLGGNSVTVGVVSYKGRALTLGTAGTSVDMIQTDASINPGNSGGPLINTRGQVIGINTLIITQGAPQSSGVGFSVPINVAKEVVPQLRDKGKVVRGWLGVQIQPISEDMAKSLKLKDTKGAIISDLSSSPKGPAEEAGVKPGDVVVAVDDRPVADNGDLSRYIASHPPGTKVHLKILRDGAEKTLAVTLGTFPDENQQADEGEKEGKAQLGMTLRNLSPDLAERLELPRGTKGVVVMDVEAGEAAEEAGLQRGDVIVSVNGAPVEGVDTFEAEVAKAKSEGLARLRVRRGNSHSFVILKFK
jgi:serine protease Do